MGKNRVLISFMASLLLGIDLAISIFKFL